MGINSKFSEPGQVSEKPEEQKDEAEAENCGGRTNTVRQNLRVRLLARPNEHDANLEFGGVLLKTENE